MQAKKITNVHISFSPAVENWKLSRNFQQHEENNRKTKREEDEERITSDRSDVGTIAHLVTSHIHTTPSFLNALGLTLRHFFPGNLDQEIS